MTAIITKQNAKDKAFISLNNGGGDDGDGGDGDNIQNYIAGNGIQIDDVDTNTKSINVKFDETLTLNEKGQLHVVNSGGDDDTGGDSSETLWKHHNETIDYKWNYYTDYGDTLMIDDTEYIISEFINDSFQLKDILNTGVIVTFSIQSISFEITITKNDDGTFTCPIISSDFNNPSLIKYVNTNHRAGIIHEQKYVWENLMNTFKDQIVINSETLILNEWLSPINESITVKMNEIVASNVPIYEHGTDNFDFDYQNIVEIEKTLNGHEVYYCYWTNTPKLNNGETSVIQFNFPTKIFDDLEFVICFWRDDQMMYQIPMIIESGTKFIVEMVYVSEGPGICITKTFTSPKELLLKGDILCDWLPQTTRVSFDNNVKCNIIEADNVLKLHKTPVPFMYLPKDWGETTINDIDYWYMNFGYSPNSQEFQNLCDGQPFEFTDTAFGTNFNFKKSGNKWIGNNFCMRSNSIYDTSQSAPGNGNTEINILTSDENKKILSYDWNYTGGNIMEFLMNKGLKFMFNLNGINYEITKLDEQSIGNHDIDGKNYDKLSCLWMYFNEQVDAPDWKQGTLIAELYYTDPDGDINKTKHLRYEVSAECHYSTSYFHGMTAVSLKNKLIINTISDKVHYWIENDKSDENNGLIMYMRKNMVWRINDNSWDGITNPFSFIAEQYAYEVLPKPEHCSSLKTNYNIQTTGIVIGSNIESHAFSINQLGNNIDVLVNDVDYIEREVQIISLEVSELSKAFNNYVMMDVLFGFFEGVGGAISGAIAAGMRGSFKFGERTAMEAAETSMRIGGEDFERISIESELSVSEITSTTGRIDVRSEMNVEAISGETASFSEFSTSESGAISTNMIRPINDKNIQLDGNVQTAGIFQCNKLTPIEINNVSIEMDAENISMFGSVRFDSEVSGSNAIFEHFETSEIFWKDDTNISELSILRDNENSAFTIKQNQNNRLLFDDDGDFSIMSAAEGWSEEAFRSGREMNDSVQNSFVSFIDRDLEFSRVTTNPSELVMTVNDRLVDGLKFVGEKFSMSSNLINYAKIFGKEFRFINEASKGIVFDDTDNNYTISLECDNMKLFSKTLSGFATDDLSTWTDNNMITALTIKNKFALKDEIPENIDLSNYYTKTENDELFLKTNDLGNELRSEYTSFFQEEVRICGFNIYFDTSTPKTIKMRSNIEIIGENKNETVKFTNCKPIDTDGYSYITEQNLNDYYTKNDCDTKYVAKNDPIELSATYNDTYPITISGDQTYAYACDYIKFVADKEYDNIQYTINYQKGTNQGLIFRCNGSDLMRLNNDDKSTIVWMVLNMC